MVAVLPKEKLPGRPERRLNDVSPRSCDERPRRQDGVPNGCNEKDKQSRNRSAWHTRAGLANFWPHLRALGSTKELNGG